MRHVTNWTDAASDGVDVHVSGAPPPAASALLKWGESTTGVTVAPSGGEGGREEGHSSAPIPALGKSGEPLRTVGVMFHPELRRTKEVIRRPEWVRRSGEGVAHRGSLSSMALFGILFANCVGGGYGFEDGIGSAGPLITLIVCAVLPWLWVLPTGLSVAELSTAVPSNSGVLMWTNAAFPPFISFLCILATIFITFVGNATYPNLTAAYAQQIGDLAAGPIVGVKVGVVVLCCVLNCVGVEIVGGSSVLLCAITILPFLLLTVIQLFAHGFNKAVLHVNVSEVKWAEFFSIISWNYANIENAGAVVEEVANPRKAFPKAMILLMFSTYAAYVMPMLAGVSAMGVGQDYSQWKAGHWPEVARVVAGEWLKYLLFAGALLSGVGFTLTSMCCTSRLLAGMGTMHMFPKRISRVIGYYHPRLGTPIPAILLNSVVTLIFSVSMDFTSVVSLCQSIYSLRMVLIYAALLKLRIQYPKLPRPYALPFRTWVTALVLAPAAAFSVLASTASALTSLGIGVALISFVVVGSGVSWLYCRIFARNGFQGVIVACEVSPSGSGGDGDDDAAAGVAAGEANEGELGEGVFYVDSQADGEEPGQDLLLGMLPFPTSATAATAVPTTPIPAFSNASHLSNSSACYGGGGGGGGSPPLHMRRGVADLDGVLREGDEELVEVGGTLEENVNSSTGKGYAAPSESHISIPKTRSFLHYCGNQGEPTTLRHRRCARGRDAGGHGGGNGGPGGPHRGAGASDEESEDDTSDDPEAVSTELSGALYNISAGALSQLSPLPPPLG